MLSHRPLGKSVSTMAIAALMGLGAMGSMANGVVFDPYARHRLAAGEPAITTGYRRKQRVTMAQQKRARNKARNVAKHRRHA